MRFCSTEFKETLGPMSLKELSEKAGISLAIAKNITSGRKKVTPQTDALIKMCEVLNVNPLDFFVRKTRVITIFSNKGGSGKTTTCANLGYSLAVDFGLKVLMIDTDQQQNLTRYYNISGPDTMNLYTAFNNQESIENYIIPTGYENLDIVCSHFDVGKIDPSLPMLNYREKRFRNIIQDVKDKGTYDYILIDCNPSLSMFNTIILCASDYAILPLEPTAFGLGGIENVIEFVDEIKRTSSQADNHKLEILGIIITIYDKRVKMSAAISQVAEMLFDKGQLFDVRIPIDASVGKSQVEKKPLGENYKMSNATVAYRKLAQEVIKRVKSKEK